MSYIHLTIEKRSQIEVLRKEGYSVRRIASLIGVHHSTVARELNRVEGEYSAIKAQQLAISKSANKGRPTKLTPQLAALIESRLQQTWSPEEVVGAELVGVLSFKTIYSWIHRGFLAVTEKVLRRKGKKPGTEEKRGRFNVKKTIKDRPQEVENRKTFGHWELDTIVSSRGQSKFADAYAAWQRGSNENSNGLLREFFPKKTDLAKVTLDKLTEALVLINNRPRKCLGFKTPFDMFKHEIRKLI